MAVNGGASGELRSRSPSRGSHDDPHRGTRTWCRTRTSATSRSGRRRPGGVVPREGLHPGVELNDEAACRSMEDQVVRAGVAVAVPGEPVRPPDLLAGMYLEATGTVSADRGCYPWTGARLQVGLMAARCIPQCGQAMFGTLTRMATHRSWTGAAERRRPRGGVLSAPRRGRPTHRPVTAKAIIADRYTVPVWAIQQRGSTCSWSSGAGPTDPGPVELHNHNDLSRHSGVPVLGALPGGAGALDPSTFRSLTSRWIPNFSNAVRCE
jgi:hypothetical protein